MKKCDPDKAPFNVQNMIFRRVEIRMLKSRGEFSVKYRIVDRGGRAGAIDVVATRVELTVRRLVVWESEFSA